MAMHEKGETPEMEGEAHTPQFLEKATKRSRRKVSGKKSGRHHKGHAKKHSRKRAEAKR